LTTKRSYSKRQIYDIQPAASNFYHSLQTDHELRAFILNSVFLSKDKRKNGEPYIDHPRRTAENINLTLPHAPYRREAATIALFHDMPDQGAKYDHKFYARIRIRCGPEFDYALDEAVLMAAPPTLQKLPRRLLKDVATTAQMSTYGSLPGRIAHVYERTDNAGDLQFVYLQPENERAEEVVHHLSKAIFSNRFVPTTPLAQRTLQRQHATLLAAYEQEFGITKKDVEERVKELESVFYENRTLIAVALEEYVTRFGITIPKAELGLHRADGLLIAAG
jgi:hypothetical protein